MKYNDEEFKKKLTLEQYQVLRERGTEAPFSGKYYYHKDSGIYRCAACGNELFSSSAKYDSGCGWPAYYQPMDSSKVSLSPDDSLGMVRTEVTCGRCGSHLGHVFDDGPQPTGQRFCINSLALDFDKDKKE